MLTVKEEIIDKISEAFYLLLNGKEPASIHLPSDYPNNEIKQVISYINKYIEEYNLFSNFMQSLTDGKLDFTFTKSKLKIIQCFKSHRSNLKHLTWKTQQIAKGDFSQKVDFLGEFSIAFNSMTQQLKDAFEKLETQNIQLENQNKFIQHIFGRYLSDEVVANLIDNPLNLNFGGEKRCVTIMMTDLRGFTSLSERLPPEKVVSVINNYLELMTQIISKFHGTIDEFIGDAILAIFGAPIQKDDDEVRAIACAIEMQQAMKMVNKKNKAENLPEVEMGIGINTGEVIVGNIGSEQRAKYGIVGSNVNLTSRIESNTIGGQILISESTKKKAEEILLIKGSLTVKPKGVKNPISIYDVVGIGGEYNLYLPTQDEGDFLALTKEVPFKFVSLKDKAAGKKFFEGFITKIAKHRIEMRTNINLKNLTNIKIKLITNSETDILEDFYGKVIGQKKEDGKSTFLVHFTSRPPIIEAFFEGILSST